MQDLTARRAQPLGGNQDTALLKIVALVCMFIDHCGVILFPHTQELRVIGRMALPLYAWCLVVGCERTHSIVRYALRLLVLAVVSQPLNMMALNNPWTKLNILFLLFLGVCAIGGIQQRKWLSQFWAPALCYAVLGFVKVDYGWMGLTFLLLLYLARKTRAGLIATYLAYALFWGSGGTTITQFAGLTFPFLSWRVTGSIAQAFFKMQAMIWLSLPLIACTTNSRIRMPKWLGYSLYPLHLIVIVLIRLITGVPLESMLATLRF